MADRKRFSKQAALEVLDARAAKLARQFNFNRGNGTSQLEPKGREFDAHIERAVAYGQMRAYESFAEAICEGFEFERSAATTKQEEGQTLPGILCPKGGYCDYPRNPCMDGCKRPDASKQEDGGAGDPSGDGSQR